MVNFGQKCRRLIILADYRIIEEIDGNGESLFYPERKGIFGWTRYYHDCGTFYFYEKGRAEMFIRQQLPVTKKTHEITL